MVEDLKMAKIKFEGEGADRDKASPALDRIRALDEERSQLIEAAKNEAMAKAEHAIEELRELGFHYGLIEQKSEGESTRQDRPVRNAAKGTRQPSDKACPTCGFRTEPPHDARAHRSQTEKKPFTDEELAAMGRSRVDEG